MTGADKTRRLTMTESADKGGRMFSQTVHSM